MMDQYDQEIEAMEVRLDRLSRLVAVLPDESSERADVQDQGLLLYRELEDAKASLAQRRRLDTAIAVREDRAQRHRAAMNRRSSVWARGAAWALTPGVLAVLVSLPAESWTVRLAGFSLVIVGLLCLLRMAALQRQGAEGLPGDRAGIAELHEQYDQLDVRQDAMRRSTGHSPSASKPASAPDRSSGHSVVTADSPDSSWS
jgi:hypothetical protein